MSEINLTDEQMVSLTEVLEKVKTSKAYQNYEKGVRAASKRAQNLAGEGDVFARIGTALKEEKFPDYLKDLAKGQQKVQLALQAELKQKKLHGLLKNEELNDAVYGELYVEAGTLDRYFGKSTQEEQMSEEVKEENVATAQQEEVDTNQAQVEETGGNNDAAAEEGNDVELFDFPDYGEDFYNSDAFKDLKIEGKQITKEQKEKIEALYEEFRKQNESSEGNQPQEEAENGTAAQDDNSDALKIDDNANQEVQTNGNEDWIEEYNQKLAAYAAANNNTWTRDTALGEDGQPIAGLKGSFGNGVDVHYKAKNHLSIQTPKDVAPTADHFKEIIELAKDQKQKINLGTINRPEFRAALIEACAKGGVEMQNLNEEDLELYNSFKQAAKEDHNQDKEVRAAEVKDTDEKGDPIYKLSPRMAEGWLTMYRNKAQKPTFEGEIQTMEKQLAAGAYKVTGEEKARAQLLMMKYANSMNKGDKEQAETCVTALQRYGLDNISRGSEEGSKDVITGKPYSERTDEEKAKIDEATKKVLPEKAQQYDAALIRQVMDRKGQTLQ